MEAGSGGGRSEEWPIYLMCGGPQDTQINCTKRGDNNVGLGEYLNFFNFFYYSSGINSLWL